MAKIIRIIGIISVTLLLNSTLAYAKQGAQGHAPPITPNIMQQLGDVISRVRENYVEKPDETKMSEGAINGLLMSLDPHSSYLNAKGFKNLKEETSGGYIGIGIEFTQENGLNRVVTPIDGSPAAEAGILGGDIIAAIDGESVNGLTMNQIAEKLHGTLKSPPVTVAILRGDKHQKLEFKLVRAEIHIKSVRQPRIVGTNIGYIRISQFIEDTGSEVRGAMEQLQKEKPDLIGYIIDLRNNPGGMLLTSVETMNYFLDEGEVVSTKGRTADATMRFLVKPGQNISKGKPVVVLINGGSASASELVAGAFQDHKRATLIGTRSFGKGSVQTIIPLGKNQGALRLTTARYYTPSGRSIQAKGIEPDIVVEQPLLSEMNGQSNISPQGESGLRGHLKNGTGEDTSERQAYVPKDEKDDVQMAAAVDFLHGKSADQIRKEQQGK